MKKCAAFPEKPSFLGIDFVNDDYLEAKRVYRESRELNIHIDRDIKKLELEKVSISSSFQSKIVLEQKFGNSVLGNILTCQPESGIDKLLHLGSDVETSVMCKCSDKFATPSTFSVQLLMFCSEESCHTCFSNVVKLLSPESQSRFRYTKLVKLTSVVEYVKKALSFIPFASLVLDSVQNKQTIHPHKCNTYSLGTTASLGEICSSLILNKNNIGKKTKTELIKDRYRTIMEVKDLYSFGMDRFIYEHQKSSYMIYEAIRAYFIREILELKNSAKSSENLENRWMNAFKITVEEWPPTPMMNNMIDEAKCKPAIKKEEIVKERYKRFVCLSMIYSWNVIDETKDLSLEGKFKEIAKDSLRYQECLIYTKSLSDLTIANLEEMILTVLKDLSFFNAHKEDSDWIIKDESFFKEIEKVSIYAK